MIANITYDDYIWGDKFKTLQNVVYLKIDDSLEYISKISKKVPTILTHNGDLSVDDKFAVYIDKFDYWFGQNITATNSKFIPIPIGLENDYVPNAIQKKHLLLEFAARDIMPSKLLYVNHNIGTNPKERNIPYGMFKTCRYMTVEHSGGFDYQNQYYTEIKKHRFMLSPPGNGVDCHRTWEILYLGRFPILKNIGRLEELYKDLPVVFIDKYEEQTEDFLIQKQMEFSNKTFNYEKIKFNYWKNIIKTK